MWREVPIDDGSGPRGQNLVGSNLQEKFLLSTRKNKVPGRSNLPPFTKQTSPLRRFFKPFLLLSVESAICRRMLKLFRAHRCPEVDLLPPHDSETLISLLGSRVPAEKTHDEEFDLESGFKCVDVAVETQVTGQEGEGLKMVPKRQIHLKKKRRDSENSEKMDKPQVMPKKGPVDGGGANNVASANEMLRPTVHHRPDLLLRQHSMPASFHTRSMTGNDADSNRVYRGLVAGASQDETKTKMASCIIKSVLSKKMQVEQINTKTSQKKKPKVLPVLPPPADQQRVAEATGEGAGGFKAPVHVVRDMRSLVKNTYRLSFATATAPDKYRPTSFKVIGQEDSPPPTYQQAVGVKCHQKDNSTKGHVAKVAECFSQSHARKQNNTSSDPVAPQRRGRRVDDVTGPVMAADPPPSTTATVSQSERSEAAGDLANASVPCAPSPPSTPRLPQASQPPISDEEQSSRLGVSSHWAPGSSHHVLQSCLYIPSTLNPHLGKVSYIHSPLNYIQTPPPTAPTVHRLRRSEENQNRSSGNASDQPDSFRKTCPPTEDQDGQRHAGNTATPTTREQHHLNLCRVQGFLPAQVGSDFLIDITGSAIPPGALVNGPAPCHLMLEANSGRYYYVDTPPQPQRKMLLDPETGQFIQVFLPAAGPTPNPTLFPMCCVNPAPAVINPAPTMLQASGAKPTVLSVMRFQPTMALSSLYVPPCVPFTLHTPSANFTHTTL
ncbi:putative proline-rich basic protein 1 [Scophthalmus maximus]|uniref:Putative proline-rich basic protein 1 n=1 Tax=Scophthalmus maximus TaxID=52904 RepID=A0A2U9B716_SCOMX|nr:putative proline-rich basic protein 1 [Scophthalmus maximus]